MQVYDADRFETMARDSRFFSVSKAVLLNVARPIYPASHRDEAESSRFLVVSLKNEPTLLILWMFPGILRRGKVCESKIPSRTTSYKQPESNTCGPRRKPRKRWALTPKPIGDGKTLCNDHASMHCASLSPCSGCQRKS